MSKKESLSESDLTPGLRRFLYFTATITGAAIMVIEILGAKILSPYVGTSHFVWTAQIAVTLVALAVGYYAGGRMADASAQLGRLYLCITIAAVYLALSIGVIEPLAYWCLGFKLAVGSLLASAMLYFIPLALLATTGPYLVRALTSNVQTVGGNAGRLTAVSTLGSFVGTVLIGYVLLPLLPNSVSMFGTSVLLLLLASAYHLIWGRRTQGAVPLVVATALAATFGLAGIRRVEASGHSGLAEVYRGNSNFGLLQVIEDPSGHRRSYLNDYLTQNTYDSRTRQSRSLFTFMLHDLAAMYSPKIESVLCIGLGVGIVPMQFARDGAKVDVVEINPAVAPVAARYFDFDPSKVRVEIEDGRSFLNRSAAAKYDSVILDAFLGDASPAHLMSREACAAIRKVLKPQGVLVINCFGDFDFGRDFLTSSLDLTLKKVFPSVLIHASGNGNVFFVAGVSENLAVVHPPSFNDVPDFLRPSAQEAFNSVRVTNPAHGRILTDDFNPTEFYDATNREEWRRSMALSMKQR